MDDYTRQILESHKERLDQEILHAEGTIDELRSKLDTQKTFLRDLRERRIKIVHDLA